MRTIKALIFISVLILITSPALSHTALILNPSQNPQVIQLKPDGGTGSGVVVAPLVVLTARHVVGQEQVVYVNFGNAVPRLAQVYCRTPEADDMAVLSVPVLWPAHSDHLIAMNISPFLAEERIYMAGWPKGVYTEIVGRVTQVETNVPVEDGLRTVYMNEVVHVVVTSASYLYGMSGGGAFNTSGELRGIVCCVNPVARLVGIVPIKRLFKSCPLE